MNENPDDGWILPVPETMRVHHANIYLVGFGLRVPNDLTLEALVVLKRSKHIFAVPPLEVDLGLGPISNLMEFYSPSKPRIDTYREMADTILKAASVDPPVCFLTYGSAMFGVDPSHRILEEAPKRGLSVRVCNGISSLEGLWADLNLEPCSGFLVWEATRFVKQQIHPPLAANVLLVQAPFFDIQTGSEPGQPLPKGNLGILRDYLLKFYPPNHVVSFVRSEAFHQPTHVDSVALKKLATTQPVEGSSLLIPSLFQPPSSAG